MRIRCRCRLVRRIGNYILGFTNRIHFTLSGAAIGVRTSVHRIALAMVALIAVVLILAAMKPGAYLINAARGM